LAAAGKHGHSKNYATPAAEWGLINHGFLAARMDFEFSAGYARGLAAAPRQSGRLQPIQPESRQIVLLAHQARAAEGGRTAELGSGAGRGRRQPRLRMAAEGPISHQYRGEPMWADGPARQGRTSA